MLFQEVVMVGGQPGLYKMLSMTTQGMIVEDLGSRLRKRIPATASVGTLNDMALYLQNDQTLPLQDLFARMASHEGRLTVPPGNGKEPELRQYFEEIVPDYDRERVYVSVMRKIVRWYHLLRPLVNFNAVEATSVSDHGDEMPTPQSATGGDAIDYIRDQE